ncbi:MAG: isochorismate synthase [Simkania sp.]|nr:isochorismate synthase [Simkania sp.]
MSQADITEFQNSSTYPKIFWESSEQHTILLATGNDPQSKAPRFFCGDFSSAPDNSLYTPTCLKEIPSIDLAAPNPMPRMINRMDLPEKSTWDQTIYHALKSIEQGMLNKVVLARKTTLSFESPLHPLSVLLRLRRQAHPIATFFCLQSAPHKAFLGATPERLFSRSGRHLSTMAVAGTRRRSADVSEDEALAHELLHSIKDKREVDIVVDSIIEHLSPFCEKIDLSPLTILKSAYVQHLYYPIRAVLKEGVSDSMLIQALHPTPAVGGSPKPVALAFIGQHESFSRGPYAAPIGWLGTERSEISVAIRSALIDGSTLHLFAGTGIVQGSDPDAEWQELEHKISQFLRLA